MLGNLLKWKRYARGFLVPIVSPDKMKPHVVAESILDIDFEGLKKEGFRHVVFDKDNTIADYHVDNITNPQFLRKIEDTMDLFGHHNVAVYTNNLVCRKVDNCDIKVIHGRVKKPYATEAIILHFNEQLRQKSRGGLLFEPERCIVVGDRILTDIVQANQLGGLGILVQPWDLERTKRSSEIQRAYERFVWRFAMNWSTLKYNGKDMTGYSRKNPFQDDQSKALG